MKVDVSFFVKRKKKKEICGEGKAKKFTWATYWISTENKEKFRSKRH